MQRRLLRQFIGVVVPTRIRLPGLALFLLIFLAACGPATPEAGTTASTPLPAETQEEDAATAPAMSGTEDAAGQGSSAEGYPAPGADLGYPGAESKDTEVNGYPAASPPARRVTELLAEPPNPERDLPASSSTLATVGGVLVEEIVGQGFVPLMPRELKLGRIIETTEGEAAVLSTGSSSPKAALFPTGIFIFEDIEPGSYGLVVDVGYTEFPIKSPDGDLLIFEVEAGEITDLGQIITQLPN